MPRYSLGILLTVTLFKLDLAMQFLAGIAESELEMRTDYFTEAMPHGLDPNLIAGIAGLPGPAMHARADRLWPGRFRGRAWKHVFIFRNCDIS